MINQNWYLVDLPGYGYAKYSKEQRIQWMDTMQEYLSQRDTLRKVFVLIDGSISPQKIDMDFLTIFAQEKIPYDIIITKTDKCNQKELHKNLTALKEQIEETLGGLPNIIQTSSIK
ncbi:TPA: hypothetical protein DEP21_02465 [Patescibacteria group bacterium]|nr:hypothetical protein [Candidatus Gracilibacteria bacterium]